MTSTNAPGEPTPAPASGGVDWTLRTLIMRHKRFSLGVAAVLIVMLGLFVAAVAGPQGGAVSDATTCSAWGSANRNQQQAYATLYVKEHGALASRASDVASVEGAINKGCTQAFENDVSDSINVYQAINNQY